MKRFFSFSSSFKLVGRLFFSVYFFQHTEAVNEVFHLGKSWSLSEVLRETSWGVYESDCEESGCYPAQPCTISKSYS